MIERQAGGVFSARLSSLRYEQARSWLGSLNIGSLLAFGALGHFKGDFLTFFE